ncbi:hypothetical protein SARC_13773, partial [Sphaeroforma arctica JP610]
MSKLNYYKSGFGFIYEVETFDLIATNKNNTPIVNGSDRIMINDTNSTDLNDVGQFIIQMSTYNPQALVGYLDAATPIPFYYSGYIITIAYYTAPGIEWGIVTAIPMEDFTESFLSTLLVTGVVIAFVLALTLVICLSVNHSISGQLARITKQLSEFARLDFTSRVSQSGLRHPVREIARVYQA